MQRTALGWSEFFSSQIQDADREAGLLPARVVSQSRRFCRISNGEVEANAEIRGRLRFAAVDLGKEVLPVVGDWVLARSLVEAARSNGYALIERVLDRRTELRRKSAGRATDSQILAANADAAWVVMGLDGDFNLRRLERYLVLIREAGLAPVVVLNKADLAIADKSVRIEMCRTIVSDAQIHIICARTGEGVESLRAAQLRAGSTVVVLGSSGVGKSTLTNALFGGSIRRTGDVRVSDGRGRHTTTERELIELPGGAFIIDSPGLRELQLWAAEDEIVASAGTTFVDVASVASACRFRDCAHDREPGCAVRAAIDEGSLDPRRLESYRALIRELAHVARRQDARARAESKRRAKIVHRALRKNPKRR